MSSLNIMLLMSGIALTSFLGSSETGEKSSRSDVGAKMNPVAESSVAFIERDIAQLQISPNPSHGYFVVTLPETFANQKGKLDIYSLIGNKLFTTSFSSENGGKIDVDISGNQPGTYILVVQTTNDRLVSKFYIK